MDLKSSKEGTSCSSYVDSSDEEPSNEIRYTLSKMLAIREEFRKNPKRHECLLIDHCDQGIWSPLKYFDSKDRPQHSQENFNLNNNKIWKLTQSSPFKIQNGRKKSIKANISHESQSFKEDVNRFDVIKNFHKPNYSNSSQAYKPKSSNFYRKVHKPQSQQSFFTKNTPKNIVKVNLDSDKPNKSNRVEQNIETGNDRHGYRVYSYGNDQFDKISASILNDSSSLKKNIDVNTEKINVTQMSEITETVNKQEEKSFPIDLPDNVKSNQTDSILKSLEEVPKYEDKVNIVMNSIDQKLNISTIENSIFDTVCTQPIENQVSWNTQKFLTLPESIKVTEIVKPSMSKSNITKKYSDSLDNFINGLNIRNSTNNVLKNNVQNSVDYVNNIEGYQNSNVEKQSIDDMVNNLNQNVNNASWGSHQDNNNVSGLNLGWNNAQTKEPNSVFNNFNLPAFEDNSFRNGSGNFTHPDKISSDHYLMNGRPYNETCNISLYNGSSKDCAYNDAHNVAFSNSFHPNNMNGNGTTNSNFRREPQSNGPDYYRDLSMFADHNANSSVINNTRNISRTPYQRVARTHDSVNTHTNPCYYPSHYEYNFYPRHTR